MAGMDAETVWFMFAFRAAVMYLTLRLQIHIA